MNFKKLYDAVNADFDAEIALSVVQIMTINLSTKPTKKNMTGEKSFRDKILKKAKKALWELSDDDFDLSVKLWGCVPSWNIRQDMNGLGGCTVKSFKELLESYKLDANDNNELITGEIKMNDIITISWNDFETKYVPVQNHIDDNASLDGVMFETFGEEQDYVNKIWSENPKRIWSYIDDGDGIGWLESGNHPCNRLGWVITENPCDEDYMEVHEEL